MKTAVVVMVILVVSVAFYVVSDAPQKDRVLGIVSFFTPDRRCFDFHKQELDDPDSAYLYKSYVWTKDQERKFNGDKLNELFEKYEAVVRVNAKAKNVYGAYRDVWFECPLVDGKFRKIDAMAFGSVVELE